MSDSEQHRHRCETRAVLAMRARDGQSHAEYLKLVAKRRGEQAAQRLRSDCIEQWTRGATGQWGVWL